MTCYCVSGLKLKFHLHTFRLVVQHDAFSKALQRVDNKSKAYNESATNCTLPKQ